MPVSNPVLAWVATLNAGTAVGNASVTVTVNITAGWEIQIPVKADFGASVSLDPLVNIYPSSDGGSNYDSTPMTSFGIPRLASGVARASIRLSTGQYALEVRNSGPSATFAVLTQMLVTAVNNV